MYSVLYLKKARGIRALVGHTNANAPKQKGRSGFNAPALELRTRVEIYRPDSKQNSVTSGARVNVGSFVLCPWELGLPCKQKYFKVADFFPKPTPINPSCNWPIFGKK